MKASKTGALLGTLGALLVPAVAISALNVPHSFSSGDPISASQMNENFAAIKATVDALEAKASATDEALQALSSTSVQSVNGLKMAKVYCGATCPSASSGTVSDVVNTEVGTFVVTFAEPFSGDVVCTCTSMRPNRRCWMNTAGVTSEATVYTTDLVGNAADGNFMLTCMGLP